jgi:tetratricopeptide (TPR) repeat protein
MVEDHVPALLALGYESLKNADLGNASRFFDEALHENFDHAEVLFSMKCAQFWRERIAETSDIASPLQKGDQIVSRWKTFQAFLSRISGDFEMAKYAFKRMAFSVALDFFLAIPDEEKARLGAEFDFRVGRCRKALGDYETAQQHLERAVKFRKDDARFLAELADCHALSGEQRLSKVFFREAFYIAPDTIELELLESDMIQKLSEKAREEGVSEAEIAEWIPIYGELSGLFGVKRELGASETSRLNSSMLRLENDLRENPAMSAVLKPRLLNRYFWILDHYEASGVEKARIDKILLKVRLLDEGIFKQYVS